jgi:circadian clock protein KaiC
MAAEPIALVQKLPTGIPGFDHIGHGGLPVNRVTLVTGTSGSAKTVFAGQFLAEGVRKFNTPGVFVTFEESSRDIRQNFASFGWEIDKWEAAGMWSFVDASPQVGAETVVSGSYDLGALLARIEHAITKIKAKRVAIDSLGPLFSQLPDAATVRSELFRIAAALKEMQVTAIFTAERTEEYGDIARFGVEEFVSDNVIVLRNALEEKVRRRTIEILKYRGTMHNKGEFPFTVVPSRGIEAIPLSAIELQHRSSDKRVPSGVEGLDELCGGGFYRDSVTLVSGATGTGKTLIVTEFMEGGVTNDERCLIFAFEESREQLFRNAIGWGVDFEKLEREGLLKVVCIYPEVMGLEDHLIMMKETLDQFKPHRVAVDSLSALERVASFKGFREFVISLTAFIKEHEVAGLLTSTTPTLMGGSSVTESHISTITDTIILLRYVELFGEVRRGLTVLKMRGSMHEKSIREFTIDGAGMHIGKAFRSVVGILAGSPQSISRGEIERIEAMFEGG